MTPPNPKREQTLDLLTGPAIQVTLTTSTGGEKVWTLPKALLCHHASYFQRLRHFKEGEQGKVALESLDPEIFKLFVEFLYFGRYTYRDDLSDHNRVRDSARAWVLGDYLDAAKFKEMAMNNLYNIYFPDSGRPRSGIGPDAVDYYCTMATVDSPLYEFCQEVLVAYWNDTDVIIYDADNRQQWDKIWRSNPDLMSDVLFFTKTQHNGSNEHIEVVDERANDGWGCGEQGISDNQGQGGWEYAEWPS